MLATPLAGVAKLAHRRIADSRGCLERLYCADEMKALLGSRQIAQINHTLTLRQGTVRGLHFQHPPHAETKIITCLRGAVFDVAVDLRASSPTYLRWHGEVLRADNGAALVIPEGFAHGFQTLEPDCEMLYLHTAPYVPAAEGGLSAEDPAIGIRWPAPITELSERDRALPNVADGFKGLSS
ncbi:dTDP-4-dehydrorhamnose 3,5-epimerase family protein [Hyphomicrobium sp. CS1GBMeth3]|uniref:dTDP-4-dehydrorhamnose 3,5-epimerase family protein n=1 Tax=Hyphomicrobium sp. CS1GBMeth3 TaxID=1892845 RepID=UPI0009319F8E|nr:dTDP-4-dehydrorhamnose 3,5-epimerase family protein [Hyphomicrobium sp. CS1GBMeth3]